MVWQDLEGFIQLGSENIQGQKQYDLSRQCVSSLDCPREKSFFSSPAWTSLISIYARCPSSCHNEPVWRVQLCPHSHLPTLGGWLWGAPKPSLHQAVQATLSQPLLMGQLFHPVCLGAFPLSLLQHVDVFPVLEGPKLDIVCVSAR